MSQEPEKNTLPQLTVGKLSKKPKLPALSSAPIQNIFGQQAQQTPAA